MTIEIFDCVPAKHSRLVVLHCSSEKQKLCGRGWRAFSKVIRSKLANKEFAKRYLQVLVDGIVVSGDTAIMKGSHAAPGNVVAEMKKGTSEEVPTFMHCWCARLDSNQ
ncbi:MAG: hypothetical protein WAZ34_07835 [Rhodocyclaceae bacterium]